jgi:hypothetical protein
MGGGVMVGGANLPKYRIFGWHLNNEVSNRHGHICDGSADNLGLCRKKVRARQNHLVRAIKVDQTGDGLILESSSGNSNHLILSFS